MMPGSEDLLDTSGDRQPVSECWMEPGHVGHGVAPAVLGHQNDLAVPEVLGNPRADATIDVDPASASSSAPGQPGLWCDWVPCWDGCCLTFKGNGKFYSAVPWLRYLMTHLLQLGGFTFDHALDGVIIGARRRRTP